MGAAFAHSRSKTTIVCNDFNATKRSFCVNMWQWMKHESNTSLWSQISYQLSGQKQEKSVQSDQRCKHQQAKFWPPCFGMRKVFCSSIILKKEEPSISNITLHYWWNRQKEQQVKKKKMFFQQDNASCHKLIATMAKLHELLFELPLNQRYSTDLVPSDKWLLADLKRILQSKRFGSNDEVISETEAYSEAKDKSFYKNGI